MNYIVYTRKIIETINPAFPYAVISVSDSDASTPNIPENSQFIDTLVMKFDDAEPSSVNRAGRSVLLFSDDMANNILNFWLKMKESGCETIYIHCNAGQCRSPAIAAALSKLETGNDDFWFKTKNPNMHVYRTILNNAYDRNLL